MWNKVSSLVLGSENTVEWYSAINNFVAIPRFIPAGLDPETHEGFPAFGPNNDLLPLDVNVTFFFDYDKGGALRQNIWFIKNNFPPGTIETIEIFNTTESEDDESLGKFTNF